MGMTRVEKRKRGKQLMLKYDIANTQKGMKMEGKKN
jgi:hypothetical protein